MQDSNDQGSLDEALQQVNTGEHEEDGPLALVLHHSRSLDSSHFEGIPPVPLFKALSSSLAHTQMSGCPAPDFMQMDNTLVKASDLLPRKLLILDVEGLLVYDEGFMDRSSKTAAGDVVGAKKVIRRNGVQEFITRCLELFDVALCTCSEPNLLYNYTHYLFSEE
ncbi:hypothetical protein R1sor_014331 [Riccia sorocarpa]|uniref:FCP1 homology domain-containing protein n=1 Tax=Riccia sorocarpa TaxID=122646 RepID=A0ABD3H938_9MARC